VSLNRTVTLSSLPRNDPIPPRRIRRPPHPRPHPTGSNRPSRSTSAKPPRRPPSGRKRRADRPPCAPPVDAGGAEIRTPHVAGRGLGGAGPEDVRLRVERNRPAAEQAHPQSPAAALGQVRPLRRGVVVGDRQVARRENADAGAPVQRVLQRSEDAGQAGGSPGERSRHRSATARSRRRTAAFLRSGRRFPAGRRIRSCRDSPSRR